MFPPPWRLFEICLASSLTMVILKLCGLLAEFAWWKTTIPLMVYAGIWSSMWLFAVLMVLLLLVMLLVGGTVKILQCLWKTFVNDFFPSP